MFKGTVGVISNAYLFIKWHTLLAMVPLKLWFLYKVTCAILLQKQWRKFKGFRCESGIFIICLMLVFTKKQSFFCQHLVNNKQSFLLSFVQTYLKYELGTNYFQNQSQSQSCQIPLVLSCFICTQRTLYAAE